MGQYFGPPTAPYNNPPIEPQYFKPSRFVISDITLGATTIITTSVNHNYVIGQLVRTLIPPTFGTRQLNELQSLVISIPTPDEVEIDINSSGFDAFVPSPSYGPTPPQIVAIGDINTPNANAFGRSNLATTIPGAFQNISTQ